MKINSKNFIYFSSLNLIIRIVAILAKSVAIILLSNTMLSSDYADYGIFNGFSNFFIILIGFDIYKLCQRNYPLNKDKKYQGYPQIKIYIKSYFFLILLSLVSCYIENSFEFLLLTLIVITEHFIQEFYRMLLFVKRTLEGSFLLFFKSILLLTYVLINIKIFSNVITYLDLILYWTISNIIIVLFILLKSESYGVSLFNSDSPSSKIKITLKTTSLLFLSALILRSIITIDKYLFSVYASDNHVAAYVLLISICSLFLVIFDSVYLSFTIPSIMKSNDDELNLLFKKFFLNGVIWILIIFIGAEIILSISLLTDMLNLFTNKYEYTLGFIVFVLYSISNLFEIYIIRTKLDTHNFYLSIVSGLVFFITYFIFKPVSIKSMLILLIVTFAALLILKSILVVRKISRL